MHRYIEQRHPILKGLKRETDQNQADTENPHAFFGHMISRPFDERSKRAGDRRNHPDGEPRLQSDGDRVFPLLRHQAA